MAWGERVLLACASTLEVCHCPGWCQDAERRPTSAQLGLVLTEYFFGLLQGELGQLDNLGL
jgi:hypothetical protein